MEIAEEFYLSPETIKKLVYGKKMNLPMFSHTIASAKQYAEAGMGEEWVRIYLHSLEETVPDSSVYFMSELVRIPLRLIRQDNNEKNTYETKKLLQVPLVIMYDNHVFSVPFQAEYLDCLKKEKRNSHYAFIFAKNEEYEYFWNNFGKHFQR